MNNKSEHIFLIGMMGAGKSSVGRYLAGIMHCRFIDLDRFIERRNAKSIPEIFRENGEEGFRRRETRAALELDLQFPAVIAVGGGFPLKEENMQWMKKNGKIIWLRAAAGTIKERIQNEERPLLPKPVNCEAIEKILSRRIPFYQQADISVDTDGEEPEQIAKKIIKIIS